MPAMVAICISECMILANHNILFVPMPPQSFSSFQHVVLEMKCEDFKMAAILDIQIEAKCQLYDSRQYLPPSFGLIRNMVWEEMLFK